jgi:hypothetical protein
VRDTRRGHPFPCLAMQLLPRYHGDTGYDAYRTHAHPPSGRLRATSVPNVFGLCVAESRVTLEDRLAQPTSMTCKILHSCARAPRTRREPVRRPRDPAMAPTVTIEIGRESRIYRRPTGLPAEIDTVGAAPAKAGPGAAPANVVSRASRSANATENRAAPPAFKCWEL